MSGEDDLSRIRARLRALREKTIANGCTEAEAIAASEKAAELLSRHGLSEADLSFDTFVFSHRHVGKRSPLEVVWIGVARFADCKAWYMRPGGRLHITYFGRERDVLVAEYVHDVLAGAVARALREFRASSTYKARRTARTRGQALKAFEEGLGRSITAKLGEGLWQRYGDDAKERVRRTAELLDRECASAGFNFGKVRKLTKSQGVFRDNARAEGRAAGGKIDVAAGVPSRPDEIAGLLK